MDAHEDKVPDDDIAFAKLMKKLTGHPVALPENAGRKVIRPKDGAMSVVDVTEELLRRKKKRLQE